jgi:hypothetical protein
MAKVTMDTIYDIRSDPRRVLYVLLAGAQDGGPTARAAQQAQDEKLAEFFPKVQEEVVEVASERLAKSEAELEKETLQQQAYEGMLQVEEFAERAARRLESMADRLEEESRRLGVDGKTLARAQELRVAAFIVRQEAELMARKPPYGSRGGRPLLPAENA